MNISNWSRVDTRWYLAVCCEKCRAPILFAIDRSDGAADRQPPPADKLVLTCTLDKCRHKADYTAAAILRFQKKPGEKNENGRNKQSGKGRQHR
jgi:hypothetical protein